MLSVLVPKACHLVCLLCPIWHFEGPSTDSGESGSRRDTLGFQAWISVDFGGISGPPFGSVCRSCFLLILDFESGCLRLQNQAFGVGCVAETSFSHLLGFY